MIRVVHTGYGRTGTTSLKAALERLGFGPCLHAADIFENRQLIRPLLEAIEKGSADWDAVLAGYKSFVGGPTSARWRELAEYYPEAKVIHTVRDPERWQDSMQRTLFRRRRHLESLPGRAAVLVSSMLSTDFAPLMRLFLRTTLEGQTFKSSTEQMRERAIELFEAHTEQVVEAVPASRLLVFDVSAGWEPLCEFLDVPVPAQPFPRMNDTAEYTTSGRGLGTAMSLLLRRTG
jgi:Sulfotransferase domain